LPFLLILWAMNKYRIVNLAISGDYYTLLDV